jgi:flagellar hook-associated protein 2
MATVTSSTSSGSMIDVQNIVEQLMQVERKPLAALQTAKSAIETKVSAFGSLKSELATLQDAARALFDSQTWQAATVTSSNEAAVRASSSGGAAKGAFSVTVEQLAQAQSAVTGQYASAATPIGGGTLVVQLGSSAGGSFTADGARPAVNIAIAPGATLAEVRTAINNAGAGISASLVHDGSQTRLMLRSSETGAANAFSVEVQGAEIGGSAGLGGLAFTPGGGAAMTQMQAAQDARYAIDGLVLTAKSNTVTDALDGVTLELRQVGAAPIPVEVGVDGESMRKSVDAFVTAYNALNTSLGTLTKYDAASGKGGLLQGNFVVVQLQSKLRAMLGGSVPPQGGVGAGPTRLSDTGIQIQRDGSLKIDDKKFSAAAADPQALRTLFASVDPQDAAAGGIARRFNQLASQVLGTDGAITGALKTLDARSDDNQRRQDALTGRLESTRARLVRLYTSLDSNLASMNSLSQALAGQLAGLDGNKIQY